MTIVLLGSCSAAQAIELPPVVGATGATGPAGPAGPTGPTGPAGTGGPATEYGQPNPLAGGPGGLASKAEETGGWSASIRAPKGTEQAEAKGVVSFSIPLKQHEEVTVNYRNEAEALTSAAPCLGSILEPVVEPGAFCAYRGGNGPGSKETGGGVGNIDKNAKFVQFEDFQGNHITEHTGEGDSGDAGMFIVFRTTSFSEGAPVTSLAAEANLTAGGSWAVTAK